MKKRMKELKAIISKASDELYDLEAAERDEKNAKLVGRHFRYSNSYGGDRERWWLYAKVIGIEDGSVITLEFQTDCDGRIEIIPRRSHYPSLTSGWERISRVAWETEWATMLESIPSPNPTP